MIIKEKSILVAAISSLVIFVVLVFTLVGYVIHLELRHESAKRFYRSHLHRIVTQDQNAAIP